MPLPLSAKNIPDFDHYFVTPEGDFFYSSPTRLKQLRPAMTSAGYLQIRLVNPAGERRALLVHRVLAALFVPGDTSLTVDHLNGIKTDNRLGNLQWVSRSENSKRAVVRNPGRNEKIGNTLSRSVTGVHARTGAVVKFSSTKEAVRWAAGHDNCSRISASILRGARAYGYTWTRP
jgi:hypothetical protein